MLKVVKLPTQEMSRLNCVYVNTNFKNDFITIKGVLFTVQRTPLIPETCIGLNALQRDLTMTTPDQQVNETPINIDTIKSINILNLNLEPISFNKVTLTTDDVMHSLIEGNNITLNRGQSFFMFIGGNTLKVLVHDLTINEPDSIDGGFVTEKTKIFLSTTSSKLEIGDIEQSPLMRSDFSFEELGIGGLKQEFSIMFRRAFVQRAVSHRIVDRLGIPHVKGILLFGPPGTGKTLIARQIGSLLNSHKPKIVNGPEILNKYVGQSEENIRNLFKDAEEENKKSGNKSRLHIIIFDELDAIFKARGTGTTYSDQIVNQLLSKMDGVDALNNVLIIGMTNRPDLIDKALLRPGRFEIHIEISLPDVSAREEIFRIHTKEMFKNNLLNSDVRFDEMALLTRNYTGAEISAIVKSAVSFALERKIDKNNERTVVEIRDEENVCVGMKDFISALNDVKPSFGYSESDFASYNRKFYDFPIFKTGLSLGTQLISKLQATTSIFTSSLLIHGSNGVGKTTLAVKIALASKFPFVKLISPKNMVGMGEYEKVNYIKDIFLDAYKSKESIIILDDIESIIDYVGIGPRFSNTILQAIKIFVKSEENNKLFVIGTSSNSEVLKECGLYENFYSEYFLSEVTHEMTKELVFKDVEIHMPMPIKNLIAMFEDVDMLN